ncbi:MAG: cytochrome-c oxidase, cbb3-type subunit I, partial [Pseudomonadota bacterium]
MDAIRLSTLALIALIGAYAADQGNDLPFRIHGLIVMLVAAGLFLWQVRRTGQDRPAPDPGEYQDGVVRAGVIATAFWG